MNTQRLLVVAVIVNAILLTFIAARPSTERFDRISVREFELVDDKGKERVKPDRALFCWMVQPTLVCMLSPATTAARLH